MLAPKNKAAKIALALTWDGARRPITSLPAKARAWLGVRGYLSPSRRAVAALLAANAVAELRICWVPQLKGGDNVLAAPFATPGGRRIAFRAQKTIRFSDVLGIVYRK